MTRVSPQSSAPWRATDRLRRPATAGQPQSNEKPRGLLGDAWRDLRRKPLFWISSTLIVIFLLMAAFRGSLPRATRPPARWIAASSSRARTAGSGTTSRARTSTPGSSMERAPPSRSPCSP
ncbi:hypothetical protein NKG94_41490 [Micromonospora sp. M12]